MTTETKPTVVVKDSHGRSITIQKLNALDRLRLFEALGSELSDNTLYLGYAMIAACVTAIDNAPEASPNSKRDIELMVQKLGDEGLAAINKGYKENFAGGETGDLAKIKN